MQVPLSLFLVSVTLLPTIVHAQALPLAPDTAEIRTAGVARQSVAPDLATITISFTAEDSTPLKAGQRLAARADSFRQALKPLGIPRDSVVAAAQWGWWAGRMEVVQTVRRVQATDPRFGSVQIQDTSYRAKDILEVRIHDLTKIGAVIDAALALGMTDISGVTFSRQDVDSAQRQALREATVRAREQAELIATAAGGRLGRVLTLSTEPEPIGRYSEFSQMVLTTSATNSRTSVSPPPLGVTVTVYGRWQLLPRP
jgi:uncharacterized protein